MGYIFVVYYFKFLCENNYIGFFKNRFINDKNVVRKNKIDKIKKNVLKVLEKDIFCRSFRKDIFCVIILLL